MELGKRDAARALFNLSLAPGNGEGIVQADAVKYLMELMDPAAGMVDNAVATLSNLVIVPEGRTEIGPEGGIPVLVVELGPDEAKENVAAALLWLCTTSRRFCSLVLKELVPSLVALAHSGNPRAKRKALELLRYFRKQRDELHCHS